MLNRTSALRGLALALLMLVGSCGSDATEPEPSTEVPFASISAGDGHTCALADDGTAYCWGSNVYAQLGGGLTTPLSLQFRPLSVVGGLAFSAVSAGSLISCGLDLSGRGYCWGRNSDGQLGDGSDQETDQLRDHCVRPGARAHLG